jgi:hypothetical protein
MKELKMRKKKERKKIGGKVLMNFFENHSVRICDIVIVCSRMKYGYKVRVREIG